MSRRDDHSRSREKASVREWDKGKSREQDRDRGRHSTGGKRKHDAISDEEDDWRYRRRRMEPPAASRSAPWISSIDWDKCNNVPEMLHREVEAFVKYMSPSPVEDEIRGLVISLVTKAVSSAFPDAQVLPFGSYETKLYLPDGDIDLVIQSESMAYSNKVTVLHALANTLKRAKITSKVTIIAKAKVPIVKFVTNHGRLNVDISINQGNGVVAGKIVNGFIKDMHGCGFALRSLVMITKAFLNQRGMNQVYTGGLGSYSIVCLAISFLQMHPKIRSGEIDAEKNLGVLVMEFFELYGCYFNYDEVGISVRKGGTYFSKRQRGWYDFYKTNLLSIEDPTEPSNDISKGSFGIAKVRQTLAGAYGIMTTTSFLRAGIFSSRREGRSYSLRNDYHLEDMSILSSILGITQETINHRLLLQEVYDEMVLHRLLGVIPRASEYTDVSVDGPQVSKASSKANSQSARGAKSVKEAWKEADAERSDEVAVELQNGVHGSRRQEEDDEEDEGRYGISERQRKRQKNGSWKEDTRTVFTTDDEEEGEEEGEEGEEEEEEEEEKEFYGESEDDDLRAEVEEYGLEEGEFLDRDDKKSRMNRRRSYWLSKGVGPGFGDNDEDD